jgi:CHAD domain-containing protein
MKLKSSLTAAENARVLLPKLLEKYVQAGRKAASEKRSPKEMHRFRLATKQFRYTLELFRQVCGASLDHRLSRLHDLQGVLGKLSDYHSVRTLLAGDRALEAKIDRAARKTLKEFRELWASFESPAQIKRWRTYLAK